MSKADRYKRILNKNLIKFGPMSSKVYKRVTTRTGGDALISRPGTVVKTDTELTPQPLYTIVTKEIVLTASKKAQPGDYQIAISADAITLSDLQDKTTTLVLKDSADNEVPLHLYHYTVGEVGGEFIAFTVYASGRS